MLLLSHLESQGTTPPSPPGSQSTAGEDTGSPKCGMVSQDRASPQRGGGGRGGGLFMPSEVREKSSLVVDLGFTP